MSDIKPVLLLNDTETYSFLPAEGDVTLACLDLDDDGAHKGFALSKATLREHSPFFRDLLSPLDAETDASEGSESEPIFVEEQSGVVGLLLSALVEPGKHLLGKADLTTLELARRLACKWQLESTRSVILLNFIAAYGNTSANLQVHFEVIAEAVYQGDAAVQALRFALGYNKPRECHPGGSKLKKVQLSSRLFTEFGGATVPMMAMAEVARLVASRHVSLEYDW